MHVTEKENEAVLTLSNLGGRGPIAFLSHQQEPAMRKFSENGADRVLASVTKRLFQKS